MLPQWVGEIAGLFVIALPFFLATRWNGVGFLVSVLAGWGIIHWANVCCEHSQEGDNARISAVFTGVWVIFGPLFMTVWTAFAAVVLLTISFIARIILGQPALSPSERVSTHAIIGTAAAERL